MSALRNRMLELDLIEPLDIASFTLTLTSLCHSSALRARTKLSDRLGCMAQER